jgi:uncharacterized protein (DUF58 family)
MIQSDFKILYTPGRTFFITSLFYLILSCFAFFFETFFLVWLLTGVGLIPFIVADWLLLYLFCDKFQVERQIPSVLSQGETVKVKLLIKQRVSLQRSRFQRPHFQRSRFPRPFLPHSVKVYDLHPDSMSTGVFPAIIDKKSLKDSDTLVFEYNLLPNERGRWIFSGVEFLFASPMGFWRQRVTHNKVSVGRTFPNFTTLARGTKIHGKAEKGETWQIRKRGQGLEFESLRDYQQGDSIRLIDWRATSRYMKLDGKPRLIVKNYQEEQDQQILFILDSGYRLPDFQFDSALDAMLMLSFTALKYGDAVAAASFGAKELWIPPRKGMRAFNGLMNSLYDLHSEPVPSTPIAALETALNRLRKRSFIVLISNFREEDNESLAWILPRVEKRHLLLMVSFRESEAEAIALRNPVNGSDEEVLQTAAACTYLANRRRLYRKWEHSGLLVLETTPEHISSQVINRYLSVKKSGKL